MGTDEAHRFWQRGSVPPVPKIPWSHKVSMLLCPGSKVILTNRGHQNVPEEAPAGESCNHLLDTKLAVPLSCQMPETYLVSESLF